MKRIFLVIAFLVYSYMSLFAQSVPKQLWTDITKEDIPVNQYIKTSFPIPSRLVKLDFRSLQSLLNKAPLIRTIESKVILNIPLPDGRNARFKVFYAPIMAKELAQKYPAIKSYTAYGLDDPTAVMRFDISPKGLHAMVLSGRHQQVFINPYGKGTLEYYESFYKSDLSRPQLEPFQCSYNPIDTEVPPAKIGGLHKSADCVYRTYRLALACTGEYAEFHGGSIVDVLAAMNTTMTRVNGILERDLNITLVLVSNNDQLIFTDWETDPFTNGSGSAMLGQNQTTCDDLIGSANYDIGHVFSTGGGGVAYLASLCKSYKAGGVTGQTQPVGDPFDVDYVTHEMGHQLGANHTQNNECNRFDNAAVEPGSASTIMGYAGICSPNIQSFSDAYFHAISIQEITNYLGSTTGNSCAQHIDNGNNRPIINTMINYTIPAATPFMLTADATDSDGDGLTYCWEQMDKEIASMPPQPGSTVGPSFRSFPPQASPDRYFPQLQTLIENKVSTWEVLPKEERSLNFCLTVRDNYWGGGCLDQTSVKLEVVNNGVPFAVNYPNSDTLWTALTTQTVLWEVASTSEMPVNTPHVDILLSLDGGHTYPIVLAENTLNDGLESIVVPAEISTKARIMVKARENIFFDISNENFTIAMPQALSLSITASPLSCAGEEDANLTAEPVGGQEPYHFQWNTGSEEPYLSQLGPGTYTLTVTDSEGQVMTDAITIDTLKPLQIHFFSQDLICNEWASGAIVASVSGGAPPYQWEWVGPKGFTSNAPNLDNLEGGEYFLTITDQRSCVRSASVFLYDPNTSFYYDGDEDGYGDSEKMLHVCYSPEGYVKVGGDCDDHNSHINPGLKDICDGIDNNCDGVIDEGFERKSFFEDLDGDGFGNAEINVLACIAPQGFVENDMDCNDNDPDVYPNATEVCDGKDNDCNGIVDEGECKLTMEHGTIKRVGSDWKRVYLQNNYQSMVVIANVILPSSFSKPAVTRIREAEGNSFEIKLQNPGGEAFDGYSVTFLVVEEGRYTEVEHGVNLEAKKVPAVQTSSSEAWVYEQRSYENTYSNPVVIGQVMSFNDDRWSSFWASANLDRALPPTANSFAAGKHVGEDNERERGSETIGYIVVEEGTYAIEDDLFHASVGADMVRGVNNTSVGYHYPTNLRNLECAVLSLATMKGIDGGFPILFTDSPFADSSLVLAIDEDQLTDMERSHSSEQVAYIAFAGEQPGPIYCEVSATSSEYEWINAVSLGDITNESGNDGGYGDFTHMEVHAAIGEELFFSLMPGTSGPNYPEYWNIWVDFNRDGDFEDEDEEVFAVPSHNGMYTGEFSIPEYVSPGKTRIRIGMKWGKASDLCGATGWGEVEDYTLVIGEEIGGTREGRFGKTPLQMTEAKPATGSSLQLFPNPVTTQLTLTSASADPSHYSILILDINGRLVKQQNPERKFSQNSIHMNVSTLKSGTYTLVVIKEDGSRLTKKFVKLP